MVILITEKIRLNKEPPPFRKNNFERTLFFKRKKQRTLGAFKIFCAVVSAIRISLNSNKNFTLLKQVLVKRVFQSITLYVLFF
jgi:hypothetical protein